MRGSGLSSDFLIGVLGVVLDGNLLRLAVISAGGGLIGSIVSATVSAMVLLFLFLLVKRA